MLLSRSNRDSIDLRAPRLYADLRYRGRTIHAILEDGQLGDIAADLDAIKASGALDHQKGPVRQQTDGVGMIERLRGPEIGNISGGITGADVHPEQLETFEGVDMKVVVGTEGDPVEIASRGAENRVLDPGFKLCRTLFFRRRMRGLMVSVT